jgi:hypothetical protein
VFGIEQNVEGISTYNETGQAKATTAAAAATSMYIIMINLW